MKKTVLPLFIFLAWSGIEAGSATAVNTKAVDFRLSDQYDRTYTPATLTRPVILLASNRAGEEQSHQWSELIGEKYGLRVEILGVADVRAVPFFLKSWIKNHFRKDKTAVLLD